MIIKDDDSTKEIQESLVRYNFPEYIRFSFNLPQTEIVIDWMICMDEDMQGVFIPEAFTFDILSTDVFQAKKLTNKLNTYLKEKHDNN